MVLHRVIARIFDRQKLRSAHDQVQKSHELCKHSHRVAVPREHARRTQLKWLPSKRPLPNQRPEPAAGIRGLPQQQRQQRQETWQATHY